MAKGRESEQRKFLQLKTAPGKPEYTMYQEDNAFVGKAGSTIAHD